MPRARTLDDYAFVMCEVKGEMLRLINDVARYSLIAYVALQRSDHERAVFGAARARIALDTAERMLRDGPALDPFGKRLLDLLAMVRACAERVLVDESTCAPEPPEFYWRLAQAAVVGEISALDLSEADLAGFDLHDLELPGSRMWGARIRKCRITATLLSRACFDECLMADCDFERSNLERSSWRRATVARARFVGTVFADAILDRAVFIECDFRGADLSAAKLGSRATNTGARFLRCDLRETRWDQRVLTGVRIEDCKMYGIHGGPTLDGTEIHGADLSVAGDGSLAATAGDVVRAWGC